MKHLIQIVFLICSSLMVSGQEIDLSKEFAQMEQYLSSIEISNSNVSEAPVKWHLLHSLQVINGVIDMAGKSDPDSFNSKTNIKWRYVSIFGKIPRGQVKAPDVVNPTFRISKKDIMNELNKAKLSLLDWKNLQKNSYYEHHVLLHLNKRKIRRFLKVHTRHHLKIIRDILKAENN
ncbi:MAG: hypothetical protein WBG46_07580 [Nonlabens sp.]